MKIIKSFQDDEYYNRAFPWMKGSDFHFYWGLGDDSGLYYSEGEGWEHTQGLNTLNIMPNLKEMKRIVEKFGDLLIWL